MSDEQESAMDQSSETSGDNGAGAQRNNPVDDEMEIIGDGPDERSNTELPDEHSYLVAMEAVRGLDYFACGITYRIPIFKHGRIVFPGETFSMSWTSGSQFDWSEFYDLTFGIILLDPYFKQYGITGVTFKICEMKIGRGNVLNFKCHALQRFILEKQPKGNYFIPTSILNRRQLFADIQILPEVQLPDPLNGFMSNNLKRYRQNPSQSHQVNNLTVKCTPWPKFVYDSYDIKKVMEKINKFLVMLEMDSAPTDHVKLSFWLARNFPISEDQRYEIFNENNVTERLLIIGKALTIKEVSWFSGSAWQTFLCNGCEVHTGWALDKSLTVAEKEEVKLKMLRKN